MTKADLAESLCSDGGFSRKEANGLVDLFFETIKAALIEKRQVKLSRFGNFEVRAKRSRAGRNPQTGATIEISARQVLTFRPSQMLRAAMQASESVAVAIAPIAGPG